MPLHGVCDDGRIESGEPVTRFAISYHSNSTVNGEPVGRVFAQDIGRISPGCWSYSKDPREATLFSDWDSAFRESQKHRFWSYMQVVAVEV